MSRSPEPPTDARWAPLGIAFGLLATAAVAVYGPLGVSTTYPRAVGAALGATAPAIAAAQPYLALVGGLVRPETMLVLGLALGDLLARRLAPAAGPPPAPEPIHRHETSARRRYLGAFAGGFLLLFGARLAGGCTSGHVIAGISQLAMSGLVFGAGVFATGIATAKLLRKEA